MLAVWRRDGDLSHPDVHAGRRARKGPALRWARPALEVLEGRWLASVSAAFDRPPVAPIHPPIMIQPDQSSTPPATAFTPAKIRRAYGIDQITLGNVAGDGSGQTIAIIDAGDNPGFLNSTDPNFNNSDLHKFDQQFGLPDPPSFIKLNQQGQQGPYPPSNVSGFGPEIALDVEWSHAIAPKANIILVEGNTATTQDLGTAILLARSLPQVSVVSMSFGGSETSDELSQDFAFTTPAGHQGITFLASTGDNGAPGGYPAFSRNVVGVGGTSLFTDSAGNYVSETGWSGSGGGISQFEPQPAFQKGVVTQSTTMRTIPDVAFDADPATGVAIFDSTDFGASTPWDQIGGTSFACPAWAGIIAIADQDRAQLGLGTLDGATQTLPKLYSLPPSAFHDITTGNNGFPAGPGYDLVTGIGTPQAQVLVPLLAGTSAVASQFRAFHPFRYVVDAVPPSDPSVFTGNFTVFNTSQANPTIQLGILLSSLPPGVTLAGSNPPAVMTGSGQAVIPLPVVGLPSQRPVRVSISLRNPLRVPLSTLFEGFPLTIVTL